MAPIEIVLLNLYDANFMSHFMRIIKYYYRSKLEFISNNMMCILREWFYRCVPRVNQIELSFKNLNASYCYDSKIIQ